MELKGKDVHEDLELKPLTDYSKFKVNRYYS